MDKLESIGVEIGKLELERDKLSNKQQQLEREKRLIAYNKGLDNSKNFVGKSFEHKDEKSFITVLEPVDFGNFFDSRILRVLKIYIDRAGYSMPITFSYTNYSISEIKEDYDKLDKKGEARIKSVVCKHLEKITGWELR